MLAAMCTLILGRDVAGARTVVLGANRDEDPARPSDPPAHLSADPPLAGGRDRVAGGTWLAVRGRSAVVAVLNRRGEAARDPLRSRGLLTLEVAAAADPRAAVTAACERSVFAPFALLWAGLDDAWVALGGDGAPAFVTLLPGWHVLTHAGVDDRDEPRTAWLLGQLAARRPTGRDEALAALASLLAAHAGDDHPAVCLHEGRVRTVSASRVWLAPGEARYAHVEGRPCEDPWTDRTALLEDETPQEGT